MMTTSSLLNEELLRFCSEHVRDRLSMEILAFWGRHPNGRFTVGTIARSMDAKRLNVERAIRGLVADDIIKTFIQDDIEIYCLSDKEGIRKQTTDLAALNWGDRRAIAEHFGWKH